MTPKFQIAENTSFARCRFDYLMQQALGGQQQQQQQQQQQESSTDGGIKGEVGVGEELAAAEALRMALHRKWQQQQQQQQQQQTR